MFGALQGSDILDKVKSALPFQTLSVFDLAEAEAYQSPPQENQNADFGPNEVTKDSIGDISLDANNPFDTAAPGEERICCAALRHISIDHFMWCRASLLCKHDSSASTNSTMEC